jgi:hypothetical protein
MESSASTSGIRSRVASPSYTSRLSRGTVQSSRSSMPAVSANGRRNVKYTYAPASSFSRRLMPAMRRYRFRWASFTVLVMPSSSSGPTGDSAPSSAVNTPAADRWPK